MSPPLAFLWVLALANLIFILPERCCFLIFFNPQEQVLTNLAVLVTYLHYIQNELNNEVYCSYHYKTNLLYVHEYHNQVLIVS